MKALLLSILQAAAPCDGISPPAPVTDVVIETNPVRYEGPACLPGETCVTPADYDGREFRADGSARYVFTYVGELKVSDDWKTTSVLTMTPLSVLPCWGWQWSVLR